MNTAEVEKMNTFSSEQNQSLRKVDGINDKVI